MKALLALAQSSVLVSLRERESLFWFWIFPVLLLALLGTVFGRVERGEIELHMVLANTDPGPLGQALAQAFQAWAMGAGLVLHFQILTDPQNPEDLFARARTAVEEGQVHAALLIPGDFSAKLWANGQARVQILYRRGEAGASTAASILSEFVEEFGRSYLTGKGTLAESLSVEMRAVGGEAQRVRYVEFLLPGVILMALFINGLFSTPSVIVLAKEAGILRRYFATPLSGSRYLLGFALGTFFTSAIQVAILLAFGWLAFGVRLPLLRLGSLGYLLLSFATFLGLGFLISALSRTYRAAMALANLVNLPLQFLGGLYFPVADLPDALRWVMAANPLTHLAEGFRGSLGLLTPAFPLWANLLVPLLWLSGSVFLAALRIRLTEVG